MLFCSVFMPLLERNVLDIFVVVLLCFANERTNAISVSIHSSPFHCVSMSGSISMANETNAIAKTEVIPQFVFQEHNQYAHIQYVMRYCGMFATTVTATCSYYM